MEFQRVLTNMLIKQNLNKSIIVKILNNNESIYGKRYS